MSPFSKQALRFGIPYGLLMGVYHFVRHGEPGWSVFDAIFMGTFFGLFMGLTGPRFVSRPDRRLRESARADLDPAEQIIREGPANYLVGPGGVDGWLFLTDRRLVFRSQDRKLRRHEPSLPLDQIETTSPAPTLRLFRNDLNVRVKAGPLERFVVCDRKAWADSITEALSRPA